MAGEDSTPDEQPEEQMHPAFVEWMQAQMRAVNAEFLQQQTLPAITNAINEQVGGLEASIAELSAKIPTEQRMVEIATQVFVEFANRQNTSAADELEAAARGASGVGMPVASTVTNSVAQKLAEDPVGTIFDFLTRWDDRKQRSSAVSTDPLTVARSLWERHPEEMMFVASARMPDPLEGRLPSLLANQGSEAYRMGVKTGIAMAKESAGGGAKAYDPFDEQAERFGEPTSVIEPEQPVATGSNEQKTGASGAAPATASLLDLRR